MRWPSLLNATLKALMPGAKAPGIHHHILDTNGKPLDGPPLR
jgi:hypothetical protein